MKKILVLMLLLTGMAAAADLSSLGCYEKATGQWYCLEDIKALDVTADFEDVLCFSTSDNASCTGDDCADLVDMGCYTAIRVTEPKVLEACFTLVNSTDISSGRECGNYSLETNGSYMASINPFMLDYTKCSKGYDENGVFTIQCPYAGKRLSFDALVTEDGFIIPEFKQAPSIADALSQNAIYIVLGIAIAVVAFIVFRPQPKKRRK